MSGPALIIALAAALASASGGAGKTRLAIMGLSGSGTAQELDVGLTETIATRIAETQVFDTISPKQISALLAYEQRKDVLGACENEDCFVQVARVVKANHIVGGSVAKVGEKLVLNLVLIDAQSGEALKRTNREADSAADLLSESRTAAISLIQPLLSERGGFIKLSSNVPDAEVFVDDERRIEGVGQVISIAAGPHTVRIAKDGFYSASADLMVHPGRVSEEQVSLIPAKETIHTYEKKARGMRIAAWTTGALAVTSGVLSGVFYAQASNDKDVVDSFVGSLDVEQDPSRRSAALEAEDSFQTNQALYLSFLGGAVAAGATSLVLFLLGEDPGRYEEFHSLD